MKSDTKNCSNLLKRPELKNLGTFTSVYRNGIHKNLIDFCNINYADRERYQKLTESENIVSTFLFNIFANSNGGCILTSGSTEAIFLALYLAKTKGTAKGIIHPNIVLGKNAHMSWTRTAEILDLKIKIVNSTKKGLDYVKLEELVDRNTCLVVGTMMTTELGSIDNFQFLNNICKKKDVQLHIDAAIGGFIVPFHKSSIKYTFKELSNLQSLNVSGHKYGLSTPGAGALLIRNQIDKAKLSKRISYLSSGEQHLDRFLLTMNSLGIISWAAYIQKFQREGYANNVSDYLKVKMILCKNLKQMGFDIYCGSKLSPYIFLSHRHITDISKNLQDRGWIQSTYESSEINKQGIRIVIKKGQEEILTTQLLKDISEITNSLQN
ncbi:MAG: L-tyrosine decarboxylase [Candidatus Woesebacteria bacterium GW2011_GWA1_39_21]|uniref:glutamate decarboxylase n=1 Tax=Candidatus Woesebacteria bacterium GW2011_GWA1_39_21 TaxID=1618550 RepID=A0A0G0NGS7_9BACT|nr:MAG: L-tyrosine decarboxylase [Candidatus Woesebacteria bacterium GW2011_GWA1_39_21]